MLFNNKSTTPWTQRIFQELKFFLTTPIETQFWILILLIKLSRKSSKDSHGFK